MKNLFKFLLVTALRIVDLPFNGGSQGAAIKEGYVSRSQTNPTNTCEVFFPQNPTKAIRLVSWDALSDTNNVNFVFLGGTMPITITGILNTTNLICASNTFVQTNAIVIIQRSDDTIFSLSVLGTNQTTNIIISATNSIALATNDVLWVCTNICQSVLSCVTTNAATGLTNAIRFSGECLFQVQRRAPLCLRMTNGLNLNTKINAATVRYDDNAP